MGLRLRVWLAAYALVGLVCGGEVATTIRAHTHKETSCSQAGGMPSAPGATGSIADLVVTDCAGQVGAGFPGGGA